MDLFRLVNELHKLLCQDRNIFAPDNLIWIFQVWQNIGWDFLTLSPYEKADISNLLFKNDQWQKTHGKTKIPTWLLTRTLKFNTDPYNLSQLFFPPKFKSTVIENLSFILVSLLDHKCNLNQVRNHPLKKWPILFQLRPLAQNIYWSCFEQHCPKGQFIKTNNSLQRDEA